MSALRALAARRAPFASYAIARRAGFHSSVVRAAGKESALHHEGRAQEIEEEKQDSLQKQKDGQGHWKEGLASDSESIVKADRNEAKSTEETIKDLQAEATKIAGKKI